jgi:HSP20 family protein
MFSRRDFGWSDFEDMFSVMNQLRAHMDRAFEEATVGRGWNIAGEPSLMGTWPRTNLVDNGTSLSLTAEVPGLSEKDIKVTLRQDVLTIAGERKTEAPEGYSTHRQERPSVHFSRSFALPHRVDPERVVASVKNGILTINLEKPTEALPKQITVKAS